MNKTRNLAILSLLSVLQVWLWWCLGKSRRWIRKGNSKWIQAKSIIYTESLYRQEWDNSIGTKELFTVYSTFKSSLSLSPYLNELKHIKARNFSIRLRLGGSPLRTHKLRSCKDATPVDYFCPFCKSGVETEVHFILVCPKYAEIREQYMTKKYFTSRYGFKLALLIATTSKVLLLRLATYNLKTFTIQNA